MPYQTVVTSYESHVDILASSKYVPVTYTIDSNYVTEVTLVDGRSRKVLWEGQMLAYDLSTQKAVPNVTSYAFGAIGPLLHTIDVTDGDDVAAVVWEGVVNEALVIDNGTTTRNTLAAATRTALAGRISFIVRP